MRLLATTALVVCSIGVLAAAQAPQFTAEHFRRRTKLFAQEVSPADVDAAQAAAPGSSFDGLVGAVSSMMGLVPKMRKQAEEALMAAGPEGESLAEGMQTIMRSLTVQRMSGVAHALTPQFLSLLKRTLRLSEEESIEMESKLGEITLQEAGAWLCFKLIKRSDGDKTMSAFVLAYNNPQRRNTDWLFAQAEAEMQLAPNTVLMQTSRADSTGEVVAEEPVVLGELADALVRALMKFLDAAAFSRIAERLNVRAPPSSLAVANAEPMNMVANSFVAAMGGIKLFADTWSSVATAFSTKVSRTIQDYIKGAGWTHLKQSVEVRKIEGLMPSFLDTFVSTILRVSSIPPQHMESAKYSVFLVQYADSQEWIKYDMLYNTGSGGQTSYLCILGNNDPATGKTNWLIANMQASFTLAPDMMIIRKSASYAGGIYANTKDEIKYVPRSITQDDIEGVMGIMTGLVLEKLGSALGLSLSLPMPR